VLVLVLLLLLLLPPPPPPLLLLMVAPPLLLLVVAPPLPLLLTPLHLCCEVPLGLLVLGMSRFAVVCLVCNAQLSSTNPNWPGGRWVKLM
jgi:hypothetical protein